MSTVVRKAKISLFTLGTFFRYFRHNTNPINFCAAVFTYIGNLLCIFDSNKIPTEHIPTLKNPRFSDNSKTLNPNAAKEFTIASSLVHAVGVYHAFTNIRQYSGEDNLKVLQIKNAN